MSMMGQPVYEQTESQRLAELSGNILALAGDPDYTRVIQSLRYNFVYLKR
ncbi:hypothetical protein HOY80DRAFT_1067735 [Tuber brumale]|nr:hypothetical protein HOY80DRAFT_1067735 [Tuber brumale]